MKKLLNHLQQLQEQKKLAKTQLYLAAFGILLFLFLSLMLPTFLLKQDTSSQSWAQTATYFTADAENGAVKPFWEDIEATPRVVTSPVKQGTRSYEFNNTNPSQLNVGVKALEFTQAKHASDPQGAYFSAWYYIGAGYQPDGKWRNNFQWKTNQEGATIKGGPKTIIGFDTKDAVVTNILQVSLGIVDCGSMSANAGVTVDGCAARQNNPKPVPRNQWFHMEVYYKASKTNGQIIVWQDGVQIFNLAGANFDTLTRWGQDNPTKRSDNRWLYWGVGSYADQSLTTQQLVYVDDARITDYWTGPGTSPSPSTPTPTPAFCHLYTPGSTIPQGFGVPWDTLSPSQELLLKVICNTTTGQGQFTIGKGDVNQYIWPEAFVSQEGAPWQKITLSGTNAPSSRWLVGTGTGSIAGINPNRTNYLAAYVCTATGSGWKCGCQDAVCTGATANLWQIQKFGN